MSIKAAFRIPDQLLMPWSPQRTISVQRAAEILDLSHDTVTRMIESGELKAYRPRRRKGSPWRINYESLLALVDKMHEENGLEPRYRRE